MKLQFRFLLIPAVLFSLLLLFFLVERRPFLFSNTTYLSAILVLEIVVACLWFFEKIFFPITMMSFLLPATSLPLAAECFTLRWLFLGIGALVGLIVWMRTNRVHYFGLFHLVGLFCVLAAVASASSSSAAKVGLLKVASLFLLFLYASTGGRVALAGREQAFVHRMVQACEILVFVVSASYLVGYNMFGNPNNLGAIIGVIAMPILLWASLTAEDRRQRQGRYIALALCGVLLYVTVCRAAIVADVVVLFVITLALRRPRMLVKAAFAAALLLETMAVLNPSHVSEVVDSLTGRFIFKESLQTNNGVFGSRRAPWENTLSAVKRHPWFGTGFGTSDLGYEGSVSRESSIYTVEGTNREHGSSYLAMAEYMGLLGILPFILLLLLVIRSVGKVYSWMRRTRSPAHYAVPFALVAIAGLVHAGFEDWLFATGSYLCVFFWASAFLLVDLAAEVTAGLRERSVPAIPLFTRVPDFQRSTPA
jgi:O-antigen ligase